MHQHRALTARLCRLCGKPKGVFAFRHVDEIAAAAGIPVRGTPNYAHSECLGKAQRMIEKKAKK
jgi:hypothetical protein